MPTIISICLKYLTYDPNYNYDDEDEDENAMDADGADEDYQGMASSLCKDISRGEKAGLGIVHVQMEWKE